MTPEVLERAVLDHIYYTCGKDEGSATIRDVYTAMAQALRDRLLSRWLATRSTYRETDTKRVYYLSAEYLLGRAASQNLVSLGLYETAERMFAERGMNLAAVLEKEPDPGLGNGGLGRLAACFLDSLASLALPGFGYGIRYEYGIFEQRIEGGEQVERGDAWLRYGNPWEIPRFDLMVPVQFYGSVQGTGSGDAKRWVDGRSVIGMPYDTPIAGYQNDTVNTLRLWSAKASRDFDLQLFNAGDYRRAVEEKVNSETISRVLYPADHSPEGRELRLKQQYFFVACSISDIMRRYKASHATFERFHEKVAIQLNDTHPAIGVAELMRVLIDLEGLPWATAWDITQRTFGYTNHTLMPEALEKWPVEMFAHLLPRHLELIFEINAQLLGQVHIRWPGDEARRQRMSIIEEHPERSVRMAHLAAAGSHRINGVAAIHSELVRTRLLPDFAELYPERFINATNGVSLRRWVRVANPQLAALYDQRVGPGWLKDATLLTPLGELADDPEFTCELERIKLSNKQRLAALVFKQQGLSVDPAAMFVVQVKRIHEYKRQILAALHIIDRYRSIRANPEQDSPAQVFVFAGKAAPGYDMAKRHIRLLNDLASIINRDPLVAGRLSVVFMANYNVSLAELIIPAADVSLQISLAGTEASGTGNMKLSMNGALTVGTLDGANVEIREAVGEEHFFLFGMDERTASSRRQAYEPAAYVRASQRLSGAIELLQSGFFSPDDAARTRQMAEYLLHQDPFMVCADFDSYVECQDHTLQIYNDRALWMRHAVKNMANLSRFSSDSTIAVYAREVWAAERCDVDFDTFLRELKVT